MTIFIKRRTKQVLLSVVTTIIISCCGQSPSKETFAVEAYTSYNSTDLPPTISLTLQNLNYDSTINYAQNLIGLPNTDIEIKTTPIFGAFSAINKQDQRRFFIYSPTFFDSVYSETQTKLAVLSICFHELAHQFYRHPLKPTNASLLYEKQADRYSGFQMCIIGATLEQSLSAMKAYGNDNETPTHPDKASRLAEIEKGYVDAKIKIFKDLSYVKRDSILKSKELMNALFIEKSYSEIQTMTYSADSDSIHAYTKNTAKNLNPEQLYSLYGDLIFLTNDMKIKLVSNDEIIGEVLEANLNSKILNLAGVKFLLESKIIYSINPDGFKLEVGGKIIK
jgi:hypothetical protein